MMSHKFDPQTYGPTVADWLATEGLQGLTPAKPIELGKNSLTLDLVFPGKTIVDHDMARCCLAGLWLYRDFLHESHELSQEIETTSGSYWHGIMHRREPDYGNAKYWFHRVGRHPVFEQLGVEAKRVAAEIDQDPAADFLCRESTWDSYRFIDLCEAVESGRSKSRNLCMEIQRLEWELLFEYCYRQAIS